MSTTFTWTCNFCGQNAEATDVAVIGTVHHTHECSEVSGLIRRAAAYYRDDAEHESDIKVADWLDSCALDADSMRSAAAEEFERCDSPHSVKSAYAVALAVAREGANAS